MSEKELQKTNIIPVPKLMNMGNTCYLNAVLQTLFNVDELSEYFHKKYSKNGKKFADCYKDLIDGMTLCTTDHQYNSKRIVPLSFKKMLNDYITSFRGNTQQDSSECMIYMLEYLHKEIGQKVEIEISGECKTVYDKLKAKSMFTWKKEFEDSYSPLTDLFYGIQISIMKCLGCEKKFPKFDIISLISVEIPNHANNILECLDNYFKTEIINDWKCEKCNNKGGEKTLWLWQKPKYLIIHLKRFRNNGSKINTHIEFPMIGLDTEKYTFPQNRKDQSNTFNLNNVIYHYGIAYGGHYNASSKRDNKWYICDDDNIEFALKVPEIVNQNSYILTYKMN